VLGIMNFLCAAFFFSLFRAVAVVLIYQGLPSVIS